MERESEECNEREGVRNEMLQFTCSLSKHPAKGEPLSASLSSTGASLSSPETEKDRIKTLRSLGNKEVHRGILNLHHSCLRKIEVIHSTVGSTIAQPLSDLRQV